MTTIRLTVNRELGPFIIDRQMDVEGTTPIAERRAILEAIDLVCTAATVAVVKLGEES